MTRDAFRVLLVSLAGLLVGLPLSLAAVSGLCAAAGVAGVDRVHIVMVAGPVVWTCLWFGMLWIAGPPPAKPQGSRKDASR
ncbi:hypothetical protein D9623_31505 [Azospirillum brasilense]|uniref:Uncharacterized protein n=1 Tax=Azospirillum brasilense TaxID=192 RepID=A0A0P0EY21_AZOBR|nr:MULTISPECIES: hypothetical protein [Azospirillum]ALJ39234.1 hypothetical protein AMK58_27605 [Azospirillum brasilense]MDW7556895.1 hypothetical protein [Azospirillum brasilense]MDW7596664.1 hypothetical protein [Azospirillum brasilense]MDW7631545.1 hypothetical protein [Azospirillum brasilense]MDX5950340.1 hypothetical protein [Azospirillum brasilense]